MSLCYANCHLHQRQLNQPNTRQWANTHIHFLLQTHKCIQLAFHFYILHHQHFWRMERRGGWREREREEEMQSARHGWWRLQRDWDGHQENLPQVTCLITERVKGKEKREKGRNNNRHSFEWIPVVVEDEEGEEQVKERRRERRWAFKEP